MVGLEGGLYGGAEKRFPAVILSAAKDLALCIFMHNVRFFVACGSSEWQSEWVFRNLQSPALPPIR
jgi:hypothetical protein